LLTIGVLAALNRPHELQVHIRGAINNGLTRDEIREAFLQLGAYCGLPAAVDGFRVAREAFKEMDEG
ncbi:MAG TPA: carboxymuconolactone decarboxylase family protein, partial [Roseiarcus sp.]|nr:carboxymuconolactone decarboxylase family protein [Roseiarcus sp.]